MNTSNLPTVSFVIPAHNEEKYISNCLQSIFDQSVNQKYEVIVVDNDCTDNTISIAKKFPVLIIREEKKGLAYARQAGLNAAKGELLVYLDADSRIPHGWLHGVISYFDLHQDVVGISCRFRYHDGALLDNFGAGLFTNLIFPIVVQILRLQNKPDILLGMGIALRTEALRKAGGINMDFVFHGEDTALANRLHPQGKVRFLHELYITSSARRFHREGIFRTLYIYFRTFLMMQSGDKRVTEFANKNNPT